MKLATTKKFIEALNSAGITDYQFDTDLGTHFYNNEYSSILLDETNETVYNVGRKMTLDDPYAGRCLVMGADIDDIHEVRFGGSTEDVKKFFEAYGLKLDEEQMKKLLNIDKNNYDIKPITGDYVTLSFRYKSEKELALMTEEERASYQKALELFEQEKAEADKRSGLTGGRAAQITC